MKRFLITTLFSFLILNNSCNHSINSLELPSKNNKSFLIDHPKLCYAAIACPNIIEFLILNNTIDLFVI